MGYIRDVRWRSPRYISPSRNAAVREEAKRSPRGCMKDERGSPCIKWEGWESGVRGLLGKVGVRALIVGGLVSGVLRPLFLETLSQGAEGHGAQLEL